jgi:glycosyltransferase involved in cell wall biosynthesis
MNTLISICIPTFRRATLLQEAIDSCLVQTYRPIEIIIGDDSPDDETQRMIQAIQGDSAVKIQYVKNIPSLGQAANINKLFTLASGDRLVLLHDDDLLVPDALTKLARCWKVYPTLTAAFGKQYLLPANGEPSLKQSESFNREFSRSDQEEGLQPSLQAAMLQQFPSDGFMVLTSAAREVGFRAASIVGDGCDFDFGLRLGLLAKEFYFINEYTAQYRISETAVSTKYDNNAASKKFELLTSLNLTGELDKLRKKILQKDAQMVVSQYLRLHQRKQAWKIFISQYYPIRQRTSLRGLWHLTRLLLPISI